jgi:GNAT superfamily N-acetyltransferase
MPPERVRSFLRAIGGRGQAASSQSEPLLRRLDRMKQPLQVWVRPAGVADLPSIAQVHVAAWRQTYRGLIADSVLDGLSAERRERQWRLHLARDDDLACLELAEDQTGEIIGFGATGGPLDGALGWDGELYALYLLDRAKGQGVGRRLFRSLVGHVRAAGTSSLGLWVLRDNHRARVFYARCGAAEVGRRVETPGGRAVVEIAMILDEASIDRALARIA